MLTVWCYQHYQPYSCQESGLNLSGLHCTLHCSPLRHSAFTAVSGSSIQYKQAENGRSGFKVISVYICCCTFPAQVCLYSAILAWVHFVWPLNHLVVYIRVCVCARKYQSDASLPQIGVERWWKKNSRNSQTAILNQSQQLLLFPITHRLFHSHTSQHMSSHLHSAAWKLCRSISIADAYRRLRLSQLASAIEKNKCGDYLSLSLPSS